MVAAEATCRHTAKIAVAGKIKNLFITTVF
jgi:hypothetical protein